MGISNNNNIKQSLRREQPSRRHVVFREVLHKNKKVLKSKIKNTKVTDLKTTKTSYCPNKKDNKKIKIKKNYLQ